MPELILLAVVSLTAMGLLVYLFLKLNESQTTLIQSLTLSNQSLLNQVRSKDIGTLAGLMEATGQPAVQVVTDDPYMTVEDIEMKAYLDSVRSQIALGDEITDEDLAALRGEM